MVTVDDPLPADLSSALERAGLGTKSSRKPSS
jgi:hypothetical protein